MPARNGVAAATMIAAGCTGVDDVFFGERGFFSAYDESARIGKAPAPEALIEALGKRYDIAHTNIKRLSVGSPIQAALDSLIALMRSEKVRASDVERVTVRISKLGANTTDNRDMPAICLQHLCAIMLLDGTVTFESAHDEARMRDRDVLSVRRRVELIGDDALQALLPQRQAIVTLGLKDGRMLTHRTHAVRGTAQNPMTRDEVDEKCHGLLAPSLGRRRARALCDSVWAIERIEDMRRLGELLRSGNSARQS
jgi:2-methylcitrate dehydratase PrpD